MKLSVTELKNKLDNTPQDIFLLDVRDEHEFKIANIGGCLIPMQSVASRLSEIDFSKQVVILCHHGIRSQMVVQQLQALGYENIYNLEGGIDAWSHEIDPNLPRY